MANSCPICGKDDQIKKVSAIVQGGISRSTGQMPVGYSYTDSNGKLHSGTNYENFSTTHVSNLARTLSPPPPPTSPKSSSYYTYQLIILGAGTIGFFVASVILVISSIIKMFGANNIFGDALPASIFGVGVLVFAVGYMFALWVKNHRNSHEKAKKMFEVEMPMWEGAMKRWERLYYCERDDSVYVPGEESVHVSKIMGYLHWHPYHPISFWERI